MKTCAYTYVVHKSYNIHKSYSLQIFNGCDKILQQDRDRGKGDTYQVKAQFSQSAKVSIGYK